MGRQKFSTAQPELVQLGKREPAGAMEQVKGGPVADKFFAIAAFAAFWGSAGLGIHLWLMRHGAMAVPGNYVQLRELHALIQFELFFGLLILGFILQAGPKLLRAPERPQAALLLLPASALAGIVWLMLRPETVGGRILLSLPFAAGALRTALIAKSAPRDERLAFAPLFLISLAALAAVPWVAPLEPPAAVLLFWAALGGALFGATQQFAANFIGGNKLTAGPALRFCAVFLAALMLGAAGAVWKADLLWRTFGAGAFGACVMYLLQLRVVPHLLRGPRHMLRLVFGASFFWALTGAALAVVYGLASADFTLHCWGIGWAGTAALGVSAQVLGFLASRPLFSSRAQLFLIACWQITAAGRGLPFIVGSPPALSWVVAATTTVVITWWMVAVVRASGAVIQAQRRLRKNERLTSC